MRRLYYKHGMNCTNSSNVRSHGTYGWGNEGEIAAYDARMQELQLKGLLVWPPPKQLERVGRKDTDCVLLDMISGRSNALRPKTVVLCRDGPDIKPDTVLKRSNSDCGHHVVFPDERRMRTTDYIQSLSPCGEMWLMQDYVPTLVTLGEWRTFIVNGAVIHTVHTCKRSGTDGWKAKLATSFWSLDEIW